jgi:hypothetical protein
MVSSGGDAFWERDNIVMAVTADDGEDEGIEDY